MFVRHQLSEIKKVHVVLENTQTPIQASIPTSYDFRTSPNWKHPLKHEIMKSFITSRGLTCGDNTYFGGNSVSVPELCLSKGYVTYAVPVSYIKHDIITNGPLITTYDVTAKFIEYMECSFNSCPFKNDDNDTVLGTIPVLIVGWDGHNRWIVVTDLPVIKQNTWGLDGCFMTSTFTDIAYGITTEYTSSHAGKVISPDMLQHVKPLPTLEINIKPSGKVSVIEKHKRKKRNKTRDAVPTTPPPVIPVHNKYVYDDEDMSTVMQCIIVVLILIMCVCLVCKY